VKTTCVEADEKGALFALLIQPIEP